MLDAKIWTRTEIEHHSLDMRQFADFRPSSLPNGMRIIEAYNASGLTFTILPDRGMDIWTAHYKGIPLTWISPASPHPPDFGQPWLRQFNGGLLTTCGLTHVGPPETDDLTGEVRDLHGLYSRLRADQMAVQSGWYEDDYSIHLSGRVAESRLFGEQLILERRYTLHLHDPAISIEDGVTNLGDNPSPLMLLYHVNLGYPLVRAGARLHTSGLVYPRDDAARAGFSTWAEYAAASVGYPEQVFFHHTRCDEGQTSLTALTQPDFGLALEWDTSTLPYLTQWKNTRQGIYVCGIEPGNGIPEGQNAARQHGRLEILQPGETRAFRCSIRVLDGEDRVRTYQARIENLRNQGRLIQHCHLEDYAAS